MISFVIDIYKGFTSLLNKKEKRKILLMLFLTSLNSLLEVISLAFLLPLINLCLSPEIIFKNSFLHWLYTAMHFDSTTDFILFTLLSTLAVFIIKVALSMYISYVIAKYTYDVATRITETNFYLFYGLTLNEYNHTSSSVFLREIRNNPPFITASVMLVFFQLLAEVGVLILLLAGLAITNISVLMMFAFIIVPLMALIYRGTKTRVEILGRQIVEADTATFKSVYQNIFGFVDIVLLNKQKFFIRNYIALTKEVNRLNLKKSIYNLIPSKIVELIAVLGILVIFVYHSYIADSSHESLVALLTVFALASYRMMPSVNKILLYVLNLKNNAYVVALTKEFQKRGREAGSVSINDEAQFDVAFNESIEFRNVGFEYPSKKGFRLQALNMVIRKGEKIGMVGKSGSGKTTIINLLLRFLQENQGDILVDGRKLDRSNIVSWRKKIGYVQQNTHILDGSLKENIAFGSDYVDEQKLMEVLKLSQLHELVSSWENGIETHLGENGALISGGQKQRIGIARALYRNAEILVFDEATSALDSETEKEISDSIESLSKNNITIIMIAHRVTTLKTCDRIYELSNGMVSRVCTYNDLINENLPLLNA